MNRIQSIELVMSSSPELMDVMLTAIWSVMKRLDPARNLHLSILHSEISCEAADSFVGMLKCWKNLSVEFIDIMPLACRYALSKDDIRKLPTCYPLLGPELFPKRHKMISFDSDIIVKADIGQLWDTPLGDAMIGAVLDVDFNGQINGGNCHYRAYYQKIVPLSELFSYVQAGVVVYQLDAFRAIFPPGELFAEAISGKYKYHDQDVLNMKCAGHILQLDMRWNVIHNNLGYRIPYIISLAQDEVRKQYDAARKDPWIIHYAGCQKPWDDRKCDFAQDFWDVARETPLSEKFDVRYAALDRTVLRRRNSVFRRCIRWMRYTTGRLCMRFNHGKLGRKTIWK